MARLPRVCPPGIPQHVIQRGNNRQVCFADTTDFAVYAQWLYEAANHYGVDVHAWVFMTNHVHLLLTPLSAGSVSGMMQAVGRRYVRYFNRAYGRTGTLWEGRFRSCLVDTDGYFLTCQQYIEMNPVRAGMVIHPADYHWSSYQANALGVAMMLHTPHDCYRKLGASDIERQEAYRGLFASPLDETMLADIRGAVNKGFALGSERFKDEVEVLTARRMRAGRPGPKPKRR